MENKTLWVRQIVDSQGNEVELKYVDNIAITLCDNLNISGIATRKVTCNDDIRYSISEKFTLIKSEIKIQKIENCTILAFDYKQNYTIKAYEVIIKYNEVYINAYSVIEWDERLNFITDKDLSIRDITGEPIVCELHTQLNMIHVSKDIIDKTININKQDITITIDKISNKVDISTKYKNIDEALSGIITYKNILYYYFNIDITAFKLLMIYSKEKHICTVKMKKYNNHGNNREMYIGNTFGGRLISTSITSLQNEYLSDAVNIKQCHNNTLYNEYLLYNVNKLMHMIIKVANKDINNYINNCICKRELIPRVTKSNINGKEYSIPFKDKPIIDKDCSMASKLLIANIIINKLMEACGKNLNTCNNMVIINACDIRNELTHSSENISLDEKSYELIYNNLMTLYNYYIHRGNNRKDNIKFIEIASCFSINTLNFNNINFEDIIYNGEYVEISKRLGTQIYKKDNNYYINIETMDKNNYKPVIVINNTSKKIIENINIDIKGHFEKRSEIVFIIEKINT